MCLPFCHRWQTMGAPDIHTVHVPGKPHPSAYIYLYKQTCLKCGTLKVVKVKVHD